jgi:hypothetical protein
LDQHAGGFEQIGPQEPITPFRDVALPIQLARLSSAWCQAEISADG